MPKSAKPPALIADIGATHVRFALTGADGKPRDVVVFNCSDHPDLLSAARAYLKEFPAESRPNRGAFAIACPVRSDQVQMTNLGWAFSIDELRRQLGLTSLSLINDFAAIAHAVPHLSSEDRRQIGSGKALENAPAGVVGPGTGLGISGLIPANGAAVALETEGGHVTLAATDPFEAEVINTLRQRFDHVSAERVLSGPGLVNLYEALVALNGGVAEKLTPEQVSAEGLSNPDSLCGQALETFCAMLGTVAADLALSLGARGGIYIAGGIVRELGEAFDRSGFRRRFESVGRLSGYLENIATYVITHPNPALLGLANTLDHDT